MNEPAIHPDAIDKQENVNRINEALPEWHETADMAALFKALADPTRLRIVQALLLEKLCVYDISSVVDVSVSAISHQLRLLRQMRIVKFRKQGKQVYYSLDDEHIAHLVKIALEHVKE